jgi:glycosyltransferase involved in cell wall biosynthesis
MNIVLIALTRGHVSGGFRKYLDRVVPLLRRDPAVETVELFTPPQIVRSGERTWPRGDDLRGFPALRRAVSALEPDVVFIPTARVLNFGRTPVMTMVQNMEPLEVPFGGNALMEGLKNVARAATARAACRRAARIIAVSEHVRNFLVERWNIPRERIGMVYHGIDPADDDLALPAALAPLAGGRFVFTAGSIRPARGLEDAIRALSGVPSDVRLVIAGSVDRGAEHYGAKMRALAKEQGVESRVIWAGQLDARAMSWCYRSADAFIMTSRAEACPNIVLEAMAQGAASVSTTHPPMPEFFGDNAWYYRERDAGDLVRQLNDALAAPPAEGQRRRNAARARAATFPWEATARATVAEFRLVIDSAKESARESAKTRART